MPVDCGSQDRQMRIRKISEFFRQNACVIRRKYLNKKGSKHGELPEAKRLASDAFM
jgi:hypothetical protein